MKRNALLPLAVLLVAGCTGGTSGGAPDFTVHDTEGNTVALSDLEGKPVVIMFGAAVGCEACKAYSKNVLQPLAQDTNGSVQLLMLSIASGETDQDLRQLKAETGATWPFARDTDRVAQRYGVYTLTTIVVLDAEHTIALKEVEPSASKVRDRLDL